MEKEFVTELKCCPWYEKMFDVSPVIMIHLTGSRLYGITDNYSDYDLSVVCDKEKIIENKPNVFFAWRGKKVHWNWLPISLYTKYYTQATPMQNLGLFDFYNIGEEKIVYKNEYYSETTQNLLLNKEEISQNGARNFINQYSNYIKQISETGYVDENHYTKILSHLCRIYYKICNEQIDNNFICSIKRIRWRPVSTEYKVKAADCLKKLSEYI